MARRTLLLPVTSLRVVNGSVSLPSIAPIGDPDTGFYFVTNEVLVTINGVQQIRMRTTDVLVANPILGPNGSATAPAHGFSVDGDSGMFRITGHIGFAWAADAKLHIGVAGLKIDGTADHATTVGTNILSMFTGTAPAGTLASGGSLYVATATNVELNYIDSAGNAQQLSTT